MTRAETDDMVILAKECLTATAKVRRLVQQQGISKQEAVEKVFPDIKVAIPSLMKKTDPIRPYRAKKALAMIAVHTSQRRLTYLDMESIAHQTSLSTTTIRKLAVIMMYGSTKDIDSIMNGHNKVSKVYSETMARIQQSCERVTVAGFKGKDKQFQQNFSRLRNLIDNSSQK